MLSEELHQVPGLLVLDIWCFGIDPTRLGSIRTWGWGVRLLHFGGKKTGRVASWAAFKRRVSVRIASRSRLGHGQERALNKVYTASYANRCLTPSRLSSNLHF